MGEFIVSMIASGGYLGIVALMILENVFPPLPSELILPFIGLLVAQGTFSLPLAIFSATVGSVVGTSLWFLLGWFVSVPRITSFLERYGTYIAISVDDFTKATNLFKRFQIPAVLFGRMMPTVRSVISVPAGCIRMSIPAFLFFTCLGSLIWNTALIFAGSKLLGNFEVIEHYLNPVTNAVVGFFVLAYVLQVVRFHFFKNHKTRS